MYYQLTMQFGTDEIEDAKKVLELAKELDLKRAGLQEKLPEPETFPWEETPTKETPQQAEATIPRAKDWMPMENWMPMDEPAPEPVKPTPEPVSETVKPTPEPDQAPAKEITLEELQKAGVAFAKEKGVAVLKVFLAQMGASKICEIPKEKYQEAWEALHA